MGEHGEVIFWEKAGKKEGGGGGGAEHGSVCSERHGGKREYVQMGVFGRAADLIIAESVGHCDDVRYDSPEIDERI